MNATTIGGVSQIGRGSTLLRTGALAAMCIGLGAMTAHAQKTTQWSGSGADKKWSTSDNWTNGAPATGDTLTFINAPAGGAGTKTQTNDFTDLSVAQLNFSDASHPSGYVLNGNKLTLTGATPVTQGGRTGHNTINLDLEIDTAASFGITGGVNDGLVTINGVISEKVGPRDATLANNAALLGLNTFSGKVTLGTISLNANITINTLGNSGVNQSLGTGSLIQFGNRPASGNLTYTGGATSTDKGFQIGENTATRDNGTGGGSFINNGSGAVTWTGTQTRVGQLASIVRNFTLGGSNTDNNDWQSAIQNNTTAGSTVSLTKTGGGKWILSGANTYGGATTVSEGTLLINGDQSGATGTVTVASAATLGGDGRIGGAVTLESGGTLKPADAGGGVPTKLTIGGAFDYENGTLDLSGLTTLAPGTHELATFPSRPVNTFASVVELPTGATVGYTATSITLKAAPKGTVISIR